MPGPVIVTGLQVGQVPGDVTVIPGPVIVAGLQVGTPPTSVHFDVKTDVTGGSVTVAVVPWQAS